MLVGGTDPSGGAGLAADLRAVAAAGVHGAPVVTAVTVQTSSSVLGWTPVPPGYVAAQAGAVLDDGPVGSVKSGMLGGAAACRELLDLMLMRGAGVPWVLDPVLAAGSGDSLGDGSVGQFVKDAMLPACTLCTPNLDEAEVLAGIEVRDRPAMEEAARRLAAAGPAVLVKGGHLPGDPADFLLAGGRGVWFEGRRTWTGKIHGTGCTLASAAAARMALGFGVEDSVAGALAYLRRAAAAWFPRGGGVLLGHLPMAGPRSSRPDASAFYAPPRFCSRCGGLLSADPGAGPPQCGACGLVHYRNPLPAVSVVVEGPGGVLLAERAVDPGKGLWCLPGGFLELGETVEQCGRRELAEETGLEADLEPSGVETDMTEYGGILLVVMRAVSYSGRPTPGDDAAGLGWFDPSDPPPLAFAAHARILGRMSGGR